MRVAGQPAYVLHSRAYGETSLLLEVFTRGHGRLGLIAKGARQAKSRLRALLNPFQPLHIGWAGKGELPTLIAAEAETALLGLNGETLFCGFYLNELLVRLLPRHDAHESLYDTYEVALQDLQTDGQSETTLRLFEKRLLQELGYALLLEREAHTQVPIRPDGLYRYLPEQGPVPAHGPAAPGMVLRGASLLALAAGELHDAHALRETKQLMRTILNLYLDGRPLHSRKLFRRLRAPAATGLRTTTDESHEYE